MTWSDFGRKMTRIVKRFRELKKKNQKAFIVFLMGGDPSLKETESLVYELEKRGVDMIEIGVPFSDPIADGPTIQRAGARALKNKVTLQDILGSVKSIRKKSQIPLLIMTYYNPVFKFGLQNFVKAAKTAGLDGLIIPDLTPEESGELRLLCRRQNLDLVFFIAPTSTLKRIKQVNLKSSGFIYGISLLGVTGERRVLFRGIKEFLRRIEKQLKLPLAIGFGISTPSQAQKIGGFPGVSGVIVGSAIVKKIEENSGRKDCLKKVGSFVESLVRGLKNTV